MFRTAIPTFFSVAFLTVACDSHSGAAEDPVATPPTVEPKEAEAGVDTQGDTDSGPAEQGANSASEIASTVGEAGEPTSDDDDVFELSVDAAGAVRTGFKISGLAKQGWSRFKPTERTFIALSGPPGGPLSFSAHPYEGDAAIPDLFRAHGSEAKAIEAEPETLELGGGARDAQSFRTGESLATTAWCVVKIPSAPKSERGLVLVFGSGSTEDRAPSCADAIAAPALEPIVKSFELITGPA